MSLLAAASGNTAMWFLTRGTGVTTLILLTLTVALGVANVRRLSGRGIPRFVLDAVHRNAALLSVAFLAVHVSTSVLDGYVQIRWLDAVIPFGGHYRPFWLGLGAVSLDLMAAVVVTSLLRQRLGHRTWRLTHWLAYASWPVAFAHSLGMGTDATSTWMIGLALACLAVVGAAIVFRLQDPQSGSRGPQRRVPAPPRSRDHSARPPAGRRDTALTGGRR
jgi:sulfoxide reductase heme-binding subunit YedZ